MQYIYPICQLHRIDFSDFKEFDMPNLNPFGYKFNYLLKLIPRSQKRFDTQG